MDQYHKDPTKNLDQLGRKFSMRKSSGQFSMSDQESQNDRFNSNFKSTLYDSQKLNFDSSIVGFNNQNLDKSIPNKKQSPTNQQDLKKGSTNLEEKP